MPLTNERVTDRFSTPQSGLMLPDFRRPRYTNTLRKESLTRVDAASIFGIWSLEGEEKYYRQINNALLTDNSYALKRYKGIINDLREAIRQNPLQESVTVYRSLKLDPAQVQHEYKIGKMFLWPTFSSTSRDKIVAKNFSGNYLFEIHLSAKDGCTYCSDISKYSEYPDEKEVLIYPYSGFRVKQILVDDRIIQLECVDTLQVEAYSRELISNEVKLFDEKRQVYVYLYKQDTASYRSHISNPNERSLIPENQHGYWDTHYRYHHKNGYILKKKPNIWKEYHDNKCIASFQQV